MKQISKNDVRVIILNHHIEQLAERISNLTSPSLGDVVIERLYSLTRPLRTGGRLICRDSFNQISMLISSKTAEQFIMENYK